jgi:hypothetical protein
VPEESEIAHFQMLLPKKWNWSNGLKPMVVQLAGTGDHVISKHFEFNKYHRINFTFVSSSFGAGGF